MSQRCSAMDLEPSNSIDSVSNIDLDGFELCLEGDDVLTLSY